MDRTLDPECAERLQHTYGLERPPSTVGEYAELARRRIASSPELLAFLRQVREGAAAIGETEADRGQRVQTEDGSETGVMCGYDALATALLRGGGTVRASCFHCGERMEATLRDGALVDASPSSIVFWLGDGPKGIPVCDHLNLFPNEDHLDAWLATNPEELGAALSLPEAVALIGRTLEDV